MDRPVFADASGTRAAALQWGGRVFVLLVVLLLGALTLTLPTHVALPALQRSVDEDVPATAATRVAQVAPAGRDSSPVGAVPVEPAWEAPHTLPSSRGAH